MPAIVGQFELPVGPTQRRRTPQLAVRMLRRKAIKNLKHFLNLVLNQDMREARRAEAYQYTPILFRGEKNSTVHKQMEKLIAQCDELLAAKF